MQKQYAKIVKTDRRAKIIPWSLSQILCHGVVGKWTKNFFVCPYMTQIQLWKRKFRTYSSAGRFNEWAFIISEKILPICKLFRNVPHLKITFIHWNSLKIVFQIRVLKKFFTLSQRIWSCLVSPPLAFHPVSVTCGNESEHNWTLAY